MLFDWKLSHAKSTKTHLKLIFIHILTELRNFHWQGWTRSDRQSRNELRNFFQSFQLSFCSRSSCYQVPGSILTPSHADVSPLAYSDFPRPLLSEILFFLSLFPFLRHHPFQVDVHTKETAVIPATNRTHWNHFRNNLLFPKRETTRLK